MHDLSNIGPRIIISLWDGKVIVTETVIFGALLAALIAIVCLWMARRLEKYPTKKQVIAETIVEFMYKLVRGTMGAHNEKAFAPYIGTLLIFVLLGNSLGLFGFRPLTADVNMTFALSTITFMLIQYNSFHSMGFKGKLRHMCEPYPFMFPLKIIEAISQPISLGFRLFGNILAGVIVMALIFTGLHGASEFLWHVTGLGDSFLAHIPIFAFLIPLPANVFFDMFEPLVQAYIFTMLTMVFIYLEMAKHGEGEHH